MVSLHGAGGWWRAGQEMTTLIASYDSSTVEETLLSALVSTGAVTAAHALAKHQVLSVECTSASVSLCHSDTAWKQWKLLGCVLFEAMGFLLDAG